MKVWPCRTSSGVGSLSLLVVQGATDDLLERNRRD